MSQQFDFLNTGNTGMTFGNEELNAVTDQALHEQDAQTAVLLPSIKAILLTLQAEIDAVADLRAYIKSLGPRPSAAAITSEYRARELYIEMIERLQQNVSNKVADYESQL